MARHRWRARIHEMIFSRTLGALQASSLLWSKGFAQYCDVAGPPWYRLAPTESVQPEEFFKTFYAGASGIVWLRSSTLARAGTACDLDRFCAVALPGIEAPFVLVTGDGDASIPSDLRRDTAERILCHRHLVSWYTQNCDGDHPKLRPFPIGLDLHTPRLFTSPNRLAQMLETIAAEAASPERRLPAIFCDLNLSLASKDRNDLVDVLQGCAHVEFQPHRISQKAIWRRYTQYRFALTAAGNGLDCHRTWELFYLGCIVITKASPLDRLYEGLPVIIVDDWTEALDLPAPERRSKDILHLAERDHLRTRLRPDFYLEMMREELNDFASANICKPD